ncbi:MAG: hypothetical protein IJQ01_03155 [Selenomonadaceae bacterium]|nr:hypothetical protein [Selenomonadaceae bacterium]
MSTCALFIDNLADKLFRLVEERGEFFAFSFSLVVIDSTALIFSSKAATIGLMFCVIKVRTLFRRLRPVSSARSLKPVINSWHFCRSALTSSSTLLPSCQSINKENTAAAPAMNPPKILESLPVKAFEIRFRAQ